MIQYFILSKWQKLKLLFFVLPILVFFSCSDEPNSTGYGLLNPEDFIEIKSFDTTRDSIHQEFSQLIQVESFGRARRLLVGNYKNLTASALIRFEFIFSEEIKKLLSENKITVSAAKLKVYPIYRFGDSTRTTFSFNVHEIKSWWDSDQFTADSLNPSHFDFDNLPIESNFLNGDSVITCTLPNDKVLAWMKAISDTGIKNPSGIYLKPTPAANFIRGLGAIGTNTNTSALEVVFSKDGAASDTIYAVTISDVHVVTTTENYNDPLVITLQSGVLAKAKLKFDLSKIPKDAIINSAVLELTRNLSKSEFGSSFQDSLYVLRLTDTSKISIDSNYANVLIQYRPDIYEGNIARMVQDWLNTGMNYGLLLSTRDPEGGVERFVFESSNSADFNKRPALKIYYTIRKD